MRIKEGFLLREVAGKTVVLQVGGDLNFNGLITLNETGALLWRLLEQGATREELIAKTESEYDAPRELIAKDIDAILAQMRDAGLLDE